MVTHYFQRCRSDQVIAIVNSLSDAPNEAVAIPCPECLKRIHSSFVA